MSIFAKEKNIEKHYYLHLITLSSLQRMDVTSYNDELEPLPPEQLVISLFGSKILTGVSSEHKARLIIGATYKGVFVTGCLAFGEVIPYLRTTKVLACDCSVALEGCSLRLSSVLQ